METKKEAHTKYCIISSKKGFKNTYGLKAACPITGETLFCQEDISTNLSSLKQLATQLSKSDVDPLHLPGIIEDLLEELYG